MNSLNMILAVSDLTQIGLWIFYVVLFISYISNTSSYIDFIGRQFYIDNLIEITYRWMILGGILTSSAILFTRDFIRMKTNKKINMKMNSTQTLNYSVMFFLISAFIIPNPVVSLTMLIVGIFSLILNQINGRIWFLGLNAIIVQYAIMWEFTTRTLTTSYLAS